MKKILVIGASGFVGKYIAKALLAEGYAVRCLARSPAKVHDLTEIGGEAVQGDMSDPVSMQQALKSVDAAYISVHTLSPQPASKGRQSFLDVERDGLENIVAACRANGVRRLIYITFLGAAPDSLSAWVRERWAAEQFLLGSGLDVTVVRPGQIVGPSGYGFEMMMSQVRKSTAVVMGSGRSRWRNIAIEDLVYYLVGVLSDPRAHRQCYDVGNDDILTNDQMLDVAAETLGRQPPRKLHFPQALLSTLAPLIERMNKLPKGSFKGLAGSIESDAVGNPLPIREILPRPPLSYRKAVQNALAGPI